MMSVPTGNAGRSLGARSRGARVHARSYQGYPALAANEPGLWLGAREPEPRPASPAGTLGQREFRLVLDVLDADALRPPDEDGPRVRGVDHVVEDAHVLCLGDVLVDRVDQHRKVVEQRLVRIARLARMELDVRAADLDARITLGGRERRIEAVTFVRFRRQRGIGREERDVVEVVLAVGRSLDQPDAHVLAEIELVLLRQFGNPQGDVLEGSRLTRTFGAEQRQLPASSIGTDEREVLLPVDDVHPELRRQEFGDRLPVRQPEGDVVQSLGLHAATLASGWCITSSYLRASTALCSWALLIWERPAMFRRFASL